MPERNLFLLFKRIVFIFVVVILSLIYRETKPLTGGMQDYCYTPPIVSEAVPPNVMLVIDVSGSMGWCAYNPTSSKWGCCYNNNGCGWTYTGSEEGYFEPDKIYEFKQVTVGSSRNVWAWVISNSTSYSNCPKSASGINTNNRYKGSCLNFHYMRRIDLVRWALTGGTLDSCPTDVNVNNPQFDRCNPMAYGQSGDQTSCNEDGCLLKTYGRVRVFARWERINGTEGGILFQLKRVSPQPRFGLMEYSDRGNKTNFIRDSKVYIGDFTASASFDALNPYKNVITAINAEDPEGATPTGPALWDVYNYFAQKNPQFGGLSPQQGEGDKWKNYMYQCKDQNNDGNCQGNEFVFVPCAKNFVILLTDGQWNTGSTGSTTCTIDNGFENLSADPVVPAYWLHKKGFYNQAANNTYSYVEAIYGIGLWLGGTGELSLKNVAMYGSFDRSKEWPDNLTGYPQNTCGPVDDCCSGSNCGKGSSCTPLPPSSKDWDADGNGVPDTFYSASNAKEIKESIVNAIYDILRRASSGATVATLSQRVSAGALIFQPYFYPRFSDFKELSWIGFLKAFWIDFKTRLKEDTNLNKILDLIQDYTIHFTSSADIIWKITNDTTCEYVGTSREELKPVMDAGCNLAATPPDVRKIFFNMNGTLKELSLSNSEVVNFLQNMWDSLEPTANATCIIRYLRGEDEPCNSTLVMRSRTFEHIERVCLNISGRATWKLGDIFFSTPSIVSSQPNNSYHLRYGDKTYLSYIRSEGYKRRNAYVIVGANDGMLHAFRVGFLKETGNPTSPLKLIDAFNSETVSSIGKEEWAFIPQNALPYLVWYGSDSYCHIPTVDYKPLIFDANFEGTWRTYLLGIMGFGGKVINATGCPNGVCSSSLFLLDLTDWLEGRSDRPLLKWEIKLPDNTLTLSYPQIIKVKNKWYVVLGSGPLEVTGVGTPYKIVYPSVPRIYFFDLSSGELKKSLSVPSTSQAVGSLRAVDLGTFNDDGFEGGYSDDLIYFGTYGTGASGNLYRIYLLDSSNNHKMPEDLTDSDIKSLFSPSLNRPIFAAPELTFDSNKNLWVFIGTGIYLDKELTLNFKNYFIGLKDTCYTGNCTFSLSDLSNRTNYCNNPSNYNATLLYNSTQPICSCDETGCRSNVTEVLYAYNFSYVSKGWFHELSENERMYSSPLIIAGIVNALGFVPSGDICSIGGETSYWQICFEVGCPCYSFRGETSPVVSRFLAQGAPPLGVPFAPFPTETGFVLFTQTSSGPPKPPELPKITKGRFILWIEK